MDLNSFYFQHSDAFVIPVEALSASGMTPEFAKLLEAERGVDSKWVELFNGAFSQAQQRLSSLVERSPRHWSPPRMTNVVVATDQHAAHPFHRPLFESASFVYASDFTSSSSSLELATFLLIHAERLHLAEQPVGALVQGLSYFLTLDDDEAEDFSQGAQRCFRPDGMAYKALGEALPWIRRLHHVDLRKPGADIQLVQLAATGLLLPPARQGEVEGLLKAFGEAGASAVERHYQLQSAGASTEHAAALLSWSAKAVPQVVVVDPAGETLWDPATPAETAPLATALGSLGEVVAASLQADLTEIDAVTQRFKSAVSDFDALPSPTEEIDQADGVYLHLERRLLAFALEQPAWQPLREASPPYMRPLMAARVAHEWGHLCEEAGMLSPADEAAHDAAKAGVVSSVQAALQDPPKQFAEIVAAEMERLGGVEPGAFVLEFVLQRMPDYLANLIAQDLVPAHAMEAYVRVNVRGHLGEHLPPVRLLAGLAIEYQYLGLSAVKDPLAYFLALCPAARILVAAGFIQRERLVAVLDAVAALCATYQVDPSTFQA